MLYTNNVQYTIRGKIRDVIWTCNQKLTWVSLIYRTEPTSKQWENKKKLESKKRVCTEVSINSPGNPCGVSPEEEKQRLWREGFAEKEGAVHYCKDGKASPAPRSTTMHVHPKSTSNNDETTGLNAHNGRASCSTGHQPVISHDLLGGWSIDVTQRPVRTPGNTSAMCEQQQGLNWGGDPAGSQIRHLLFEIQFL